MIWFFNKKRLRMMQAELWGLYVNGYGSPPDATKDGNLRNFAAAVTAFIVLHGEKMFRLYLVGPHTTRKDQSEALSLKLAFEQLWAEVGRPKNVKEIILIEDARGPNDETGAQINLARASEIISQDLPMIFAFEWSCRFYMRWLARCYFALVLDFLPVKFDAQSLRWRHQMKKIVQWPVEMLAYRNKGFARRLRDKKRKEHVEKSKAEVQAKIQKTSADNNQDPL